MLKIATRHQLPNLALDIDLEAHAGVTALFGPSGSGKTTIANITAGLLRPDWAELRIGDRILCDSDRGIWLPPHQRRIGYIFQDARLLPHLSVQQNLLYGRRFARGRKTRQSYDDIIAMLGLEHSLTRRPAHLSGGEKQRVAIGRALLSDPDLLIADEPLAALDQSRKMEILPYFEQLRDTLSVPILYVSHSQTEVARLATSVVALSKGKVLKQGSFDTVFGSAQLCSDVGHPARAVLTAVVDAHDHDGLTALRVGGQPLYVQQLSVPLGTQVHLQIAAQDVILARHAPQEISALNVLKTRISAVHRGANHKAVVVLQSGTEQLFAEITKRSLDRLAITAGEEIYAIIKSVAISAGKIS